VKLDAETAATLDALPNKSEFVRQAIRARLDRACALCGGSGLRQAPVPRAGGAHAHPVPRLRCCDCARESPVVLDLEAGGADRNVLWRETQRAIAFLATGDAFCPACFARSVPCPRCGHRLPGSGPRREAHVCAVPPGPAAR
jgi:hypothetical protein